MGKDVWRAARKGDIKKIKKYIPQQVKVDDLDKEYKTSLHYSIEGDQLEVLTYLLENGANINFKDPKGDTPLIICLRRVATNEKAEDLAIQLVLKGADVTLDARDRRSPERLVDSLPKRFQVKYKEALNTRLQIKRQTMPVPNIKPAAAVKEQQQQQQQSPLSSSSSNNNLNESFNSISISTPDPSHAGTNITPISPPSIKPQTGIIATVPNRPITSASGTTYQRPLQLDVVPRSIFSNEAEGYSDVKDLTMLWLEVTYKLSIVAICSEKVRYDDITKAVDECGNVLVHFLALIGDRDTTLFMESPRNQEAVSAIHERVKAVRDGIKLRLFSRIEHSELIRLVAALVGALHWLYHCWSESTQDQINTGIAECALSCRMAMNAVTYSSPMPPGVLTSIVKLQKLVGTRIFVCRSPELAKKLSDSCLVVAKTFKSLMVLSIIDKQGSSHLSMDEDSATTPASGNIMDKSPENLIALGRIIAEQLAGVKSTTATMVPSKVSGHLPSAIEKDQTDGASRMLRGSIDFYKSNSGVGVNHHGMPCEGVLLPLLAGIQKSIQSLSIYSSEERDIQMVIPAQMIAQDVNALRSILLSFLNDPSQNTLTEELNDQLSTAVECCCHFATQLLFSISAVISHNRLLDMAQVGFSVRALSTSCCVLLDSFCF